MKKEMSNEKDTSLKSKPGVVKVIFIIAITGLIWWNSVGVSSYHQIWPDSEVLLRNATLGFERIYVLGTGDQFRQARSWEPVSASGGMSVDFIGTVHRPYQLSQSGLHTELGRTNKLEANVLALSSVIAEDLTTALILDGNASWNASLKDEIQNLVRRAIPKTCNPRFVPRRYLDHGRPVTCGHDSKSPATLEKCFSPELAESYETQSHPYGTHWDILFFSRCPETAPNSARRSAALKDQKIELSALRRDLVSQHPTSQQKQHSFLIARDSFQICPIAYAVTRKGAAKLLDYVLKSQSKSWSNMQDAMTQFCTSEKYRCLATRKPLFTTLAVNYRHDMRTKAGVREWHEEKDETEARRPTAVTIGPGEGTSEYHEEQAVDTEEL